jgi:hypothetical protein
MRPAGAPAGGLAQRAESVRLLETARGYWLQVCVCVCVGEASAYEVGMAEQELEHRPITLNFSGLKATTGEPTSSWITA